MSNIFSCVPWSFLEKELHCCRRFHGSFTKYLERLFTNVPLNGCFSKWGKKKPDFLQEECLGVRFQKKLWGGEVGSYIPDSRVFTPD